ncbi:hypothetical protein QBC34DRAFT_139424 [Podospora aff. communis PSN243]|uniref:Uncharacterized protein n=1 Tax=Podospora aff. communis PSN243 TaxID=3040156 RepID=A0AAV9H400_9PEZI|nr:hypothetical protein QBC34DRAFT_139424 [Podospora aff. communis PSN243]
MGAAVHRAGDAVSRERRDPSRRAQRDQYETSASWGRRVATVSSLDSCTLQRVSSRADARFVSSLVRRASGKQALPSGVRCSRTMRPEVSPGKKNHTVRRCLSLGGDRRSYPCMKRFALHRKGRRPLEIPLLNLAKTTTRRLNRPVNLQAPIRKATKSWNTFLSTGSRCCGCSSRRHDVMAGHSCQVNLCQVKLLVYLGEGRGSIASVRPGHDLHLSRKTWLERISRLSILWVAKRCAQRTNRELISRR